MSSAILAVPCIPLMTWSSLCWNISYSGFLSKDFLFHLYLPFGVKNVVNKLEVLSSCIWQYPWRTSHTESINLLTSGIILTPHLCNNSHIIPVTNSLPSHCSLRRHHVQPNIAQLAGDFFHMLDVTLSYCPEKSMSHLMIIALWPAILFTKWIFLSN